MLAASLFTQKGRSGAAWVPTGLRGVLQRLTSAKRYWGSEASAPAGDRRSLASRCHRKAGRWALCRAAGAPGGAAWGEPVGGQALGGLGGCAEAIGLMVLRHQSYLVSPLVTALWGPSPPSPQAPHWLMPDRSCPPEFHRTKP